MSYQINNFNIILDRKIDGVLVKLLEKPKLNICFINNLYQMLFIKIPFAFDLFKIVAAYNKNVICRKETSYKDMKFIHKNKDFIRLCDVRNYVIAEIEIKRKKIELSVN